MAHAQAVQLHNLGHLFDDLEKTGSDASVCPETPLHLFPTTPTSERLLYSQLGQILPDAQIPPQVGVVMLLANKHQGHRSESRQSRYKILSNMV